MNRNVNRNINKSTKKMGGGISIDPRITVIVNDYLAKNSHFDTTHATWSSKTLYTILAPTYLLYDEDTGTPLAWNYYSVYIEGLGKITADWFVLMKKVAVGTSNGFGTTGDNWDYNGQLWDRNKNTSYSSGYLMITEPTPTYSLNIFTFDITNGGIGGNIDINIFSYSINKVKFTNNKFNGQYPDISGTTCNGYNMASNNITFIPNIDLSNATKLFFFDFKNNNLTDVGIIITTTGLRTRWYFTNNALNLQSLNNILTSIKTSYINNVATSSTSIILHGGTNAKLTAIEIQLVNDISALLTAAGHTASISYNT